MKASHLLAVQITGVLLFVGVLTTYSKLAGAKSEASTTASRPVHSSIEGTWKMVSYKYRDAPMTEVPKEEQTHLKFITGGNFIWVNYDPKSKEIDTSAGGKYVLESKTYVETPEFGLGDESKSMRNK